MNSSDEPSPARVPPSSENAENIETALLTRQTVPHSAEGRESSLSWMVLLGVLAFFLAAFTPHSGDLWLHLARGRRLVHGEYALGLAERVAPGVSVQSSWLFDLLGYALYAASGERGLVLAKALAIVVLAGILFRLSRKRAETWLAAFCTALALLSASEFFPLQPITWSYLFLSLAIFFVYQRDREERPSARPTLALFVLFLVWANVDGWCVFGLASVALFWVGEILDGMRRRAETAVVWRRLLLRRGLALLALATVCAINPRFLGVFTLPVSLAPGSYGEKWFEQINSPFERTYFALRADIPAHWAYHMLFALSAISFIANVRKGSWRRFLPWFGWMLFSVVEARSIPFFAVVAGPMLAWNTSDFLARRLADNPAPLRLWKDGIPIARKLTRLLLLLLPVLAWPGRLQAPPYEPRRWNLDTPLALQRGAEYLNAWMQQGKDALPGRGLHLTAESVYAFAWFCPQAQSVCDAQVTAALRRGRLADTDLRNRLRADSIGYTVVYDSHRARFLATVSNLLSDPQQWVLLHIEGYLAIFGRRDPDTDNLDPFHSRRLNLNRLAFQPTPEACVPGSAPEREPEARHWWDAFYQPLPPRSLEQEEATLFLLQADVEAQTAPERHLCAWENSQFAALLGSGSGWNGPVSLIDARLRLALLRGQTPKSEREYRLLSAVDAVAQSWKLLFYRARDDVSPAPLYLAVRAARRALAVTPNAAQAYLVLGESYLRLSHNTRERLWGEHWNELLQLRRCQACTALNRALLLKPDFAQAHADLYLLYGEMGYLDLYKGPSSFSEGVGSVANRFGAHNPSVAVRFLPLQR